MCNIKLLTFSTIFFILFYPLNSTGDEMIYNWNDPNLYDIKTDGVVTVEGRLSAFRDSKMHPGYVECYFESKESFPAFFLLMKKSLFEALGDEAAWKGKLIQISGRKNTMKDRIEIKVNRKEDVLFISENQRKAGPALVFTEQEAKQRLTKYLKKCLKRKKFDITKLGLKKISDKEISLMVDITEPCSEESQQKDPPHIMRIGNDSFSTYYKGYDYAWIFLVKDKNRSVSDLKVEVNAVTGVITELGE